MEITTLSEEEQEAILSPPTQTGPSKEDLIKQVEADYLAAKRDDDTEAMAVLEDRHAVVMSKQSDEAAQEAYTEHVSESNLPVDDTIEGEVENGTAGVD